MMDLCDAITQVTQEFDRDFSGRIFFNLIRFAKVSPEHRIGQTAYAQLSWNISSRFSCLGQSAQT